MYVNTLHLRQGMTQAGDSSDAVGTAVVKFATNKEAGMIVLTKSKSALTRFFTGSVARSVIHRSPCPILLC